MEQFKRVQVIMLPTNKSIIALTNSIKDFNIGSTRSSDYLQGGGHWEYRADMSGECKPQHLYVISDDEIKKGDWFYTPSKRSIEQCVRQLLVIKNGNNDVKQLKIIATTDTSLTIQDKLNQNKIHYLPQLSEQFITKYIEEYNKGEVITDVLVENEFAYTYPERFTEELRLKINPDNTITIKKLKDSWNREEVISIITKLSNQINITSGNLGLGPASLNKWIEENL